MKANVGSVTVEDKPIMGTEFKPLYVNKLFAADNGALEAGLIVSEDAAGEAIPAVLVDEADMVGTVNGSNTDFTYDHGAEVCPGSIEITHGVQVIKDDGQGNLFGDGSGSVNYKTGEISAAFDAAPDAGAPKITLGSEPFGILEGSVNTVAGADSSGQVAIAGAAVTGNIYLSGGVAVTAAVIKRLREKGVYCV